MNFEYDIGDRDGQKAKVKRSGPMVWRMSGWSLLWRSACAERNPAAEPGRRFVRRARPRTAGEGTADPDEFFVLPDR